MVFLKRTPPREGLEKLNTDRFCQDGGRIGCGGVIRGSDEEWLGGFAKFIGHRNAYEAEYIRSNKSANHIGKALVDRTS
jgi:hypothetical protein